MLLTKTRQLSEGLLFQMCYHLRKCSPRVIRRTSCPLERNNYIDHFLFTKTPEDCKKKYICLIYVYLHITHTHTHMFALSTHLCTKKLYMKASKHKIMSMLRSFNVVLSHFKACLIFDIVPIPVGGIYIMSNLCLYISQTLLSA